MEFPNKHNYIFSSVRFIIPSLAFSAILLVVFLYTVILAFRQKKLTEMKTDFVNNMTHELKTPIATISLAAQMLEDSSVRKSPESIKHLAGVISDESKRLRFQVEKVLHLSVIDNAENSLKFTDVNANEIIENVVTNFKLKVERQGGTLFADLEATDSDIHVDQLQFTNVIHNLLENALTACMQEASPRIVVRITADAHTLCAAVDNTFTGAVRRTTGGFLSTKHAGLGLGTASVRSIAEKYHGVCRLEPRDGMFCASVLLELPQEKL